MADESKLRDQVDRGERDALLLKSLEGVFGVLEEQCLDAFKRSDIHDRWGHFALKAYWKVMEDVRERCRVSIVTGENARKELVRIKPSIIKRVVNG